MITGGGLFRTAGGSQTAGNTVAVISTQANIVVDQITVGNAPYLVAVAPNGKTAYVSNAADGAVSVIDIAGS